ncbi:uncharacterized protein LOC134838415 [Culicoides brevitarsis]|uniref:uncharacterized protein LOC134838415 n=1 Tax=Culicoides brevitarsis TaxID=469753 RepID=UPI00307C9097
MLSKEKSQEIMDSDATFCTEIENRNDAQTLHEILTGESLPGKSASQPLTLSVEGKRYNTRSSLSQDETQLRKRQREQTLAAMKSRLRQIQARLRKNDISSAESQVLEAELREMSQKVDERSTKATIQNVLSQLQNIREPSKVSVVPQMAQKKKSGRKMKPHRWCKPLRFKPKSSKMSKKGVLTKNPETNVNDSQTIVALEETSLSDKFKNCKELLNQSINLFNQDKAAPYQIDLNETIDRLQEIMDRTKALMEAQRREREEKRKAVTQIPQFPPKKPRTDFDPYSAPYSEELFSDTIIPATQKNPENSWFNDSIIPLGQQMPSEMKTSFTKNSFNLQSDNSVSDLFVSKDFSDMEKDKSSSFAFKTDDEKTFFDPKCAQQSFDMNSSLMSSQVNESEDDKKLIQGSFTESLLQNSLFMSPGAKPKEQKLTKSPKIHDFHHSSTPKTDQNASNDQILNESHEISIVEPSNGANLKQTTSKNRLFNPIHVHLLAKRLHLNEIFLKHVISETFRQVDAIERQFALQPDPQSMEVDPDESHVSNTPMKPSVRSSNRKISDEIFNIPVFEQF